MLVQKFYLISFLLGIIIYSRDVFATSKIPTDKKFTATYCNTACQQLLTTYSTGCSITRSLAVSCACTNSILSSSYALCLHNFCEPNAESLYNSFFYSSTCTAANQSVIDSLNSKGSNTSSSANQVVSSTDSTASEESSGSKGHGKHDYLSSLSKLFLVDARNTDTVKATYVLTYNEALLYGKKNAVSSDSVNASIASTKPINFTIETWYPYYFSSRMRSNTKTYSIYYAGISIAYWGLIIVLASFTHILQILFPRIATRNFLLSNRTMNLINHYIFYPASFGKANASPFKVFGIPMHMPLRKENIVIGGYFIIQFIFLFINYEISTYNNIRFDSEREQLTYILAYRSGYLSTYAFPLIYVFASRNNVIALLTGWSYEEFNVYHRWIARSMLVNALIHSAAYTWLYKDNYTSVMSRLYFAAGVAATIVGWVLGGSSICYIRLKFYETFKTFHVALAGAFTALMYYHLVKVRESSWSWTVIAIWAFDHVIRISRIIYSGLLIKSDVVAMDGDIIAIDFKTARKLYAKPGQYVYIYFLKFNFWESHPFSVVDCTMDGKVVLKAKKLDGLTKKLYNYADKQPGKACKLRVWVEGPYGFTEKDKMASFDNIVLIAGGIGITPIIFYANYLKKYNFQHEKSFSLSSKSTSPNGSIGESNSDIEKNNDISSKNSSEFSDNNTTPKKVTIIWICRNEHSLPWANLHTLVDESSFDVKIYVTDPLASSRMAMDKTLSGTATLGIEYKKPSIPDIINSFSSEVPSNSNILFYTCGPTSLVDDIRYSVTQATKNYSAKISYIQDSFSW